MNCNLAMYTDHLLGPVYGRGVKTALSHRPRLHFDVIRPPVFVAMISSTASINNIEFVCRESFDCSKTLRGSSFKPPHHRYIRIWRSFFTLVDKPRPSCHSWVRTLSRISYIWTCHPLCNSLSFPLVRKTCWHKLLWTTPVLVIHFRWVPAMLQATLPYRHQSKPISGRKSWLPLFCLARYTPCLSHP